MRTLEIPYYGVGARELTAPVEVFREAAAQLEERTGGVVRGSVFTLNPGGSDLFRHTFYLLVPDLDDYTHPLFYAWHNSDFYPVRVMLPGQNQRDATNLRDEEALLVKLDQIFQSPETRSLMQALIVQARNGERTSNNRRL